MTFFEKIDDRFLMVALTISVMVTYIYTRDPVLGDMVKYMLGATAGILVARSTSQKNLIVGDTSSPQATASQNKIVADFLKDN